MAKAAQALIYLSADASTLKAPGVTFSRQLWLEQALPDNYTDETFLQSLKISIHGPIRSYWQVVREASAVTQQLDTVVAVATVSAYLYKGWMSPEPLLCVVVVPVVLAGGFCAVAGNQSCIIYARRAVRQLVLLTAGVYLMSPLLQTLTSSVSSDSIVALACGLLTMHLYLHDYTFVDQVTDTLTGSMSMTAATFASVLIASQLKTQMQVFSQVLFSLELHLLSPHARRYIRAKSVTANQVLTLTMHILVLMLLVVMSVSVASIYAAMLLFVTFVCPLCLMRVQKCKAQINGPWDEAVPSIQMKQLKRHPL